MAPSVAIEAVETRVRELGLRHPFSFGTTTITELPHVFVRATVAVDGTTATGIAADHLVPRWFIKDPDTGALDDLRTLREIVLETAGAATELDPAPAPFQWWQDLHRRQSEWASSTDYPPLAWQFGVSFLERCVIDAVCRQQGLAFPRAARENVFGVEPGAIYPELEGADVGAALATEPDETMRIRHTVGADDPLERSALQETESPGAPHALESVVETHGVDHFKVKLEGDPAADVERLADVARLATDRLTDPRYTVDANEQYESVAALRRFWRELPAAAPEGTRDRIAFVEQPFPRSIALSDAVGDALNAWDGPAIVIDESDDRPDSLGRALEAGYAGTSHKNCKGIFKSIVNATLLERRAERGDPGVMSAEDLTTVGPVSLQQDLTVAATLGIGHAERNGHHYLPGLSGFPDAMAALTLENNPDLYHRNERGDVTLAIEDGGVAIGSLLAAPFGIDTQPDLGALQPLEDWSPGA